MVTGEGEARRNLEKKWPHALVPFPDLCLAGPRVGRPSAPDFFVTDTCRSSTPSHPRFARLIWGEGVGEYRPLPALRKLSPAR